LIFFSPEVDDVRRTKWRGAKKKRSPLLSFSSFLSNPPVPSFELSLAPAAVFEVVEERCERRNEPFFPDAQVTSTDFSYLSARPRITSP